MNQNNSFQVKYNDYKLTLEQLQSKVIELTHEKDEHEIVLSTLNDTDSERKCYRMVGGALVESDVKTTIPVLTSKKENLTKTIDNMKKTLITTAEEFEKWKKDNKIQVVRS
ncbi:hypothetical protein TPHA_0I02310 [Tetrapisispora phaffii CBS 4417]|uniref:Prefoldin subunit 2 n=1 Tax=Tetrapisispora phaffii (strain ATCC 24235 / CBS 4417 / NBRC 1672 / NRRL Y-8282 / UCD 70-5) TaxID=1071381 RepID=G8BXV7_TETPH|nr:hypothetical protein TPHA_0I02310 [Tetrapisispora phaffii CBS 4417]CCE64735.1 hypothetical protein TPHA_0I02310 [Tetrapisispora phaffii CBS 4417]